MFSRILTPRSTETCSERLERLRAALAEAGFDQNLLFYTQDDYGLFQCAEPCHQQTYDNEETVRAMVERQEGMRVPSALIPRCPVCGKPMTMNLRCDDAFVEDADWHAAARYTGFLHSHAGARTLFLELGVGSNTPCIVKYPFWRMTAQNPRATYACINRGAAITHPSTLPPAQDAAAQLRTNGKHPPKRLPSRGSLFLIRSCGQASRPASSAMAAVSCAPSSARMAVWAWIAAS